MADREPPGGEAVGRLFGVDLLTEFPLAAHLDVPRGGAPLRFSCADPGGDLPWSPDETAGLEILFRSAAQVEDESITRLLGPPPGEASKAHAGAPHLLRFARVADYLLTDDRIRCRLLDEEYRYLVEVRLLGPVLALWLERRGLPALHAAAVEVGGRATAFVGGNGAGKTTLSTALVAHGCPLLTDDILAVDVTRAEVGASSYEVGAPSYESGASSSNRGDPGASGARAEVGASSSDQGDSGATGGRDEVGAESSNAGMKEFTVAPRADDEVGGTSSSVGGGESEGAVYEVGAPSSGAVYEVGASWSGGGPGRVVGRPGYPQIRLWPDQAAHFLAGHSVLGDWEALPRVHPAYTKRRVPVGRVAVGGRTREGFGRFCPPSLPVGAIYLLERAAPGTPIRFEELAPHQGLIELLRHSFFPHVVEAAGLQPRRLERLGALAAQAPVVRLVYPGGFDHLPSVVEAILDRGADADRGAD